MTDCSERTEKQMIFEIKYKKYQVFRKCFIKMRSLHRPSAVQFLFGFGNIPTSNKCICNTNTLLANLSSIPI